MHQVDLHFVQAIATNRKEPVFVMRAKLNIIYLVCMSVLNFAQLLTVSGSGRRQMMRDVPHADCSRSCTCHYYRPIFVPIEAK